MSRSGSMAIGMALTFAVTGRAAGEDLVILRDGGRRTGNVQACAGDRCSLAGQSVARSEIAWIGFGAAAGAAPPAAPKQASADAVILRDGRVVADTIVGVSLGAVVTEASEFERAEVAWICFDCAHAAVAPPNAGASAAAQVLPAAPSAAASLAPPKAPASGLPGVPDDPPPSPRPAPRPAGRATVLLNEVLFLPAAAQVQFVELRNASAARVRLDGLALVNQAGAEVTLPPIAAIDPGALAVIRFDGKNGVEGAVIHAGPTAFLSTSGWVALRGKAGELDRVAWGRTQPGGVRLSRGGVIGPLEPGSTVGRLPGSTGWGADEWVVYDPSEATPGAANGHPGVTILLPPDGARVPAPKVTLAWYPVPGAERYRLQVAGDSAFRAVLVDRLTERPPIEISLSAGSYFWRVQSINARQEEAPFSPAARLTVGDPRVAAATRRGFVHASTQEPDYGLTPDIMDVPMIKQHKDTGMLQIENINETGGHAWDKDHGDLDVGDPADNMNCVTASIAMMNAWYGGKLSQDRINYEVFHEAADGPQWDLNYGAGYFDEEITRGLTFALGHPPVEERPGNSPRSSTGDVALWSRLQVRLEAGTPFLVVLSRPHAVVVSGVVSDLGWLIINDPWVGKYVAPSELILGARLWFSMSGVDRAGRPIVAPRSDEPEVSQDSDGDGVVDFDEIHRFRTHPQLKDSDQDGLDDKVDIRASVFDQRHGYAFFGPGRDFDGDGKAMELDSDSDDGGCLDGLEDADKDGKYEARTEFDNFERGDDGCWTGSFELVLDQRNNYEGGEWTHQRHRTYGQYSLGLVPGGEIEGRAQMTAALWGRSTSGVELCGVSSFQYAFEWSAELKGESQKLPDGRQLVSFKATPERGPDFTFIWTTTCPAEPTRFAGVSFPGWGAVFNANQDEVDERFDVATEDPAILEFFTRHRMRRFGRPGG